MNLSKMLKAAGKTSVEFASKNGHIITGVGAGIGVIVTAVIAYRSRPKVDKIMAEQKEKMASIEEAVAENDISEEDAEKLKKEATTETIKRLVPAVGPVVVSTVATIGLNIWSLIISEKKMANLAALATLSETAYKELVDKTKEIVGDDKTQQIQKEIAQDKMNKNLEDNPNFLNEFALQAKGGDQLFYDAMNGRVFLSDTRTIEKVCDYLNSKIMSGKEAYITYNEFYTELELPQVIGGDDRGWGGFSLTNVLEPNMNNAIRVGDVSMLVLDWYTRPSLQYK